MTPLNLFPENITLAIKVIAGFLLLVTICYNPIADAIFKGLAMKEN